MRSLPYEESWHAKGLGHSCKQAPGSRGFHLVRVSCAQGGFSTLCQECPERINMDKVMGTLKYCKSIRSIRGLFTILVIRVEGSNATWTLGSCSQFHKISNHANGIVVGDHQANILRCQILDLGLERMLRTSSLKKKTSAGSVKIVSELLPRRKPSRSFQNLSGTSSKPR